MMKRYTAAEIETARDYIGGHADALPRVQTAEERRIDDAARMQASADAAFERMLARLEKKEAARAKRAVKAVR